MKLKKPECANCGSTAKIDLYWSKENLIRAPIKTNYCEKCATHMLVANKQIKKV